MAIAGRVHCKRDLVRSDRRAERPAGARARVRREGDPPGRGRVRRAPDAPGGRDREGARARPDERPHPGGVRRAGPLDLRRASSSARSSPGAAPASPSRSSRTRSAPRRSSLAGTDEQKHEWLPPLIEEPLLCSFALTEPNAGSDVSGIQTTAVRARRRLRPQRLQDVHLERGPRGLDRRLRLDRQEQGPARALRFVVPADAEGFTVEKHLDKMGQRATDTSALAFQDVKVPAANRLGEEGEGFKIAMRTLDHTRPGTAIGAVASRARRTSSRSTTRASASSSASRSR